MSVSTRRCIIERIEPRILFNAADLDPSFGTGGKALIDTIGSTQDIAQSVLRQSDGKLLVASSQGSQSVLVRYLATGAPDSTFGTNGAAAVNVGGPFNALY